MKRIVNMTLSLLVVGLLLTACGTTDAHRQDTFNCFDFSDVEIEMTDFLRMMDRISGTAVSYNTNQLAGMTLSAQDHTALDAIPVQSWREALGTVLTNHGLQAVPDAIDTNLLHVVKLKK